VLQLKEEIDQQENSAIDTKTTVADVRKVRDFDCYCCFAIDKKEIINCPLNQSLLTEQLLSFAVLTVR
jgi:hypothetical protein